MFFFSTFLGVFCVCFFFPVKVHIAIHSFNLEAVFFFFVARKKKYSFFIHSIDFSPKCEKNELLQEKKIRYLWWYRSSGLKLGSLWSPFVNGGVSVTKMKEKAVQSHVKTSYL